MGSQYILAECDSLEINAVKFEHCSAIWIRVNDINYIYMEDLAASP